MAITLSELSAAVLAIDIANAVESARLEPYRIALRTAEREQLLALRAYLKAEERLQRADAATCAAREALRKA